MFPTEQDAAAFLATMKKLQAEVDAQQTTTGGLQPNYQPYVPYQQPHSCGCCCHCNCHQGPHWTIPMGNTMITY